MTGQFFFIRCILDNGHSNSVSNKARQLRTSTTNVNDRPLILTAYLSHRIICSIFVIVSVLYCIALLKPKGVPRGPDFRQHSVYSPGSEQHLIKWYTVIRLDSERQPLSLSCILQSNLIPGGGGGGDSDSGGFQRVVEVRGSFKQ